MAYSASQTANTIIERVKREFINDLEFSRLTLFVQDYLDRINEALETIYERTGLQHDEFSITTVANTYEYIMDGDTGHLPKWQIDLIWRVDYDGSPLAYQYKYPEELITPTSTSTAGTPVGWYEKWDDGARYLGLKPKPDDAKTLKVYSWRLPAVITTTAGIPAIEADYYSLAALLVVKKIMRMPLKRANTAEFRDISAEIEMKIRALREANKRRKGRRVTQIQVKGPRDIFT